MQLTFGLSVSSTMSPAPSPVLSNNGWMFVRFEFHRRSRCVRFVSPVNAVISVIGVA